MSDVNETGVRYAQNTILFCEKPWKLPAAVLAVLVALTFAWGFYILDTYREGYYIDDVDDLSITEFLFRSTAAPDLRQVYNRVSPAVVGIGGRGVNAGTIGSGAIVSATGYLMTTLHGIADLGNIDVHVKTPNGVKRYEAQIVKTLPSHNLVLLKMQTQDRFLYFKLADPQGTSVGQQVFGFGYGREGNTVFKQGTVRGADLSLTAGDMRMSYLLGTDAIYSWEQTGGPLVNAKGELLAIGLALTQPDGRVGGYAVPSKVIAAHFQDIVNFKISKAETAGQGTAAPLQVAGIGTGTGPSQQAYTGSSAWWSMARAQVAQDNPAMGMNIAMGAASQSQSLVQSMAQPVPQPVPQAMPPVDTEHLLTGRIGGFHITDIIGLALLGLVAGITGGMMTMGGGILQVAGMMVIFGYGMYLIRPVAYLTNVFVYGAAAMRNNGAGLVLTDKVKALAPWAVIGIVAGYFIGNTIGDSAIAVLLGIFAMLMAIKGLHEIFADHPEEILIKGGSESGSAGQAADDILDELIEGEKGDTSGVVDEQVKNAGLGLPMGLVSGILGISGGVVEVPLQRYFGGLSLQNAIATSSVLVFWASLSGALLSFIHGTNAGLIEWQAPLVLAAIMIPGAYVGGLLGARLMKILPVVALKWFYTAIMTAIAVKMLVLN